MTRRNGHGGARPNSGPKPEVERPHAVSVKLSDAELQWLDALCHKHATSRAEMVRAALAATAMHLPSVAAVLAR